MRFEDFGLDLEWLQAEVSKALEDSSSSDRPKLVTAKQVRLQSLELWLK